MKHFCACSVPHEKCCTSQLLLCLSVDSCASVLHFHDAPLPLSDTRARTRAHTRYASTHAPSCCTYSHHCAAEGLCPEQQQSCKMPPLRRQFFLEITIVQQPMHQLQRFVRSCLRHLVSPTAYSALLSLATKLLCCCPTSMASRTVLSSP
jgi:hypothetical protein